MNITSTVLPTKDSEAIRCLCSTGEAAIWVGQPQATRFARRFRICTWFGLPLVVVSAVMLAMTFTLFPPKNEIRLVSLAGVVAGIFFLCVPVSARRKALRTVYVLTNERALIVELQNAKAHLSDSCDLKTARDLHCSAPDEAGYGDIALNFAEVERGDGYEPVGFIFRDIPSVREVRTLLEDLITKARDNTHN